MALQHDVSLSKTISESLEVPVLLTTKAEASSPIDLRVGCGSCIGACCLKGTVMNLRQDDVTFLESSGTVLARFTEMPKKMKTKGTLAHTLETDCGWLVEDEISGQKLCSAYENSSRPKICGDFKAGNYFCRKIRTVHNVQPGEQQRWRTWLELTSS